MSIGASGQHEMKLIRLGKIVCLSRSNETTAGGQGRMNIQRAEAEAVGVALEEADPDEIREGKYIGNQRCVRSCVLRM